MDKLPEIKEIPKLPKQWLINVIYTMAGEPFAGLVTERVKKNKCIFKRQEDTINKRLKKNTTNSFNLMAILHQYLNKISSKVTLNNSLILRESKDFSYIV